MRIVLKLELTMTIDIDADDQQRSNGQDDPTNARCVVCGWSRAYPSPDSAKRGIAGHKRYCVSPNDEVNRAFKRMISG